MFSIFSKIFSNEKDYDSQKADLNSAKPKARAALAKSRSTRPEILYYIAENDPDESVREAAVRNENLPMEVAPKVAQDRSENIRFALAERLCAFLPEAGQDKQSQLYAYVTQAMATLALDEVLKIRKALASVLKDSVFAPPDVVRQLARDVEREVAEPILRFCTVLPDEDLLELLSGHPDGWIVEAIAMREGVSEDVSDAVIKTQDRPGGEILLSNQSASISIDTLAIVVEKAKELEEWQRPLAIRKGLPKQMLLGLASYATDAVRDLLQRRDDFDEDLREEVLAAFERRLSFANELEAASDRSDDNATFHKVQRLHGEGALTDEMIIDAIGMHDKEFVYHAMAVSIGVDVEMVKRICGMRAAKPIVALCWKAGFTMRTALSIEKDFAQIQPKDLIYPRDGTDYPMDIEEMEWQLDFLGVST